MSDILSSLMPRWVTAPEGSRCPTCEGALERLHVPMGGPFSGRVRCTSCDYTNTVMSHLVSTAFKVESMDSDH